MNFVFYLIFSFNFYHHQRQQQVFVVFWLVPFVVQLGLQLAFHHHHHRHRLIENQNVLE
jgi:hypothetical protein